MSTQSRGRESGVGARGSERNRMHRPLLSSLAPDPCPLPPVPWLLDAVCITMRYVSSLPLHRSVFLGL